MKHCVKRLYWMTCLWSDSSGQDMLEYGLLAATLAVVVAGFLPPSVMPSVSTIFSKITSALNTAPL